MKRFKSVDIFRGICMSWMFLGHLLDWWLKPEFFIIRNFAHSFIDSIGVSGFLFISGVSITLSYQNRKYRVETLNEFTHKRVRNSYYIRSLFLLLIALIYNTSIAISINDLSWIWSWYVLMTAAFSLIIFWPLFNIPILYRVFLGFLIWTANFYLYYFLSSYQNQPNLFGVIYHLIFHDYSQAPFLNFFPFFLFGTVIGDLIAKIEYNEKNEETGFKYRSLLYLLIIGPLLIICGVIFDFPNFLTRNSLSWLVYTIGVDLTLLILLLVIEETLFSKLKKNFRFFFYYSYYSFTVYLVHNFLFLLCSNCFDIIAIWFAVFITFLLFGFLLRYIYKFWGWKASIKVLLGKLSSYLADRIEEKRR
jgi:hypothetical protein